MLNRRFLPLSLVMAATLAACALTPPKNSLLEEASNDYAAAQGNVEVVQLAPGALSEAGDALNKAIDAANKGEDSAKVDQLAYIAKQRVAIAQQAAKQKSAEAAFTSAVADRDKMRLEARTAEADALRSSAAESQRQHEASMRQAQDADARSRQLEGQLKELDAKKTERGLVITLGDVLFDTNKADLKSGGMRNVQKLAGVLKEYPQRNVLVEGFTDSTGSSEYNQDLSDRRARAVRTALQDTGVASDRISNRGYGKTFPVADNATAEGRQLNRRVEIIVSDDGKAITPR